MSPKVALTLGIGLVVVLLYLERRQNPAATSALWVPTFWLLLCGSRPLAGWFGIDVPDTDVEAGSALDRLVLSILIALAVLIVHKRRIEWDRVLRDNVWLAVLTVYLGLSIAWSDFAFVSFKRWIRLSGSIPFALVVLSEPSPLKSLESVFRRCAYVLIPLSLLLIKYFPDLGVAYVHWSGTKMWVGVASQKNSLGVLCALSAILVIWSACREWRAGTLFKKRSQLLADGLILVIALFLLQGFRGSYAATATGFLSVGTASLLLLYRMKNSVRQMATLMVLVVAVALLSVMFGESLVPTVTSVFQRDVSFTGRSDIWRAVLDVASGNPFLGVGYGGYWHLQDQMIYSTLGVREAHSGYLDVYLEVGWVGIALLFMFLLSYHRKALRELNHVYDWGLFGVCLLIMSLMHNFTESNFVRPSSYFWNIIVFVSVVFSTACLDQGKKRLIAPRAYS